MVGASRTEAQHRVVVIEDEPDLRDLLQYNLKAEGYDVRAAADGRQGLELVSETQPGLVLLDLMLPDIAGTEVCRRIRGGRLPSQPAIIMLTAKGEEMDRVVGFEIGADDYVVKPFSLRELLLRARALVRRRFGDPTQAEPANGGNGARRVLEVGALTIDLDGYHVHLAGEELHVSALEMRLLSYLAEHTGSIRTREDLLRDVWNYKPGVYTRTVDTHVKRLRDKMGRAGAMIETVRGIGYRFSAEPAR